VIAPDSQPHSDAQQRAGRKIDAEDAPKQGRPDPTVRQTGLRSECPRVAGADHNREPSSVAFATLTPVCKEGRQVSEAAKIEKPLQTNMAAAANPLSKKHFRLTRAFLVHVYVL